MTGLEFKLLIRKTGLTYQEAADQIGVSRQTLSTKFKQAEVEERFLQKVKESLKINIPSLQNSHVNEPAVDYNKLSNNPKSTLNPVSTDILMYVPLVPQYAYGGYPAGYADSEWIEELPKLPYIVDKEYHGNYMCFEVKGDSMDDGSYEGYRQGNILLCREIQRDLWRFPLHTHKWKGFVIVYDESVVIKQILRHEVSSGELIVHSLNPMYKDFTINLQEVKQLFNVVKVTRND